MTDACPNCPCPAECLRRPEWCDAMAGPDPPPTLVRSICDRSRIEHAQAGAAGPLQVVGNALAAAGRVAAAFVRGEAIRVPDDVLEARTALCVACEHYDAAADRCRVCGCGGLKRELSTEACPIGKWPRLTGPSSAPADSA